MKCENIEIIAIDTKVCVVLIVALRMSLPIV